MTLDQDRARADKAFKQAERERDGKAAMAQYQADAIALRQRTARLKQLRLAKEAEAQQHQIAPQRGRRKSNRE
jgi:hypothetical protein